MKRQTTAIAAGAAAIWLVTTIVVGGLLLREREAVFERATRTNEALALVLEENTERTLEAIEATLAGVAETLRLEPNLPRNDPRFRAALQRRLEALRPYVRALYVIGPDGWIIHDTDYPETPRVSLADRPYFTRHRDDPALVQSISDPLESRSGTGWFFAVTRRIGTDESFEGVVVAAMQPQYFETLYRRMGLGPDDVITLYHRDGVLIAGYPERNDAVGRSFADSTLFTRYLPQSPSGSYRTASGFLSYARVVSYRALTGDPLVVAIARSTDAILAGWRRSAIGAAVAMAGLGALLAALVVQFRRRQELLERARQRLAQTQKLEALGHLSGGIAHDFGNLLNIVSTNLHLLERQPLDATGRSAVELAKRAAGRGTELTARLRAIGRRQALHVVPADLSARVREASGLLRQAAGPEIDLQLALARELPSCTIDPTELEVALVNLVANARDAMQGKGRVVVRTSETREGVRVSVADTGPGMPEEVRSRVGEPYFTTKGEGGTGLGLAQVFGFAQQVGGEVRIDSRPGAGTTVELLFPKAERGLRRA